MIALLLWALASVDAAFIGYREAAGRSALINKRALYRRAVIRGLLFGQIAVMIVGACIALSLLFASDPGSLIRNLRAVGARMLIVYLPYALIIFLAFVVRAAPSVDLRSITSVLIFGPFTLARPLVVVAGVVWGFLAAPSLITFLLCLLTLVLMLGLERVLSMLRARQMFS